MSTDQEKNTVPDDKNLLSPEDIQRLIKTPFDKKIDITKKIAEYYRHGGFDEAQMQNAAKIFRTLVKDTEMEIRKTLAEAIKDQPGIPSDVILSLAQDVKEVSMPVLQFSDVLTDADLIEIVHSSQDAEKQIGISKRKRVSTSVSDALIETHNDAVVDALLHNDGARVSDSGYDKIVTDFAQNEAVINAMIERESLPISVVESLATKISDTIYKSLSEKHKDVFKRMDDVVRKTKEVATMKVIGLKTSDAEYLQFRSLMATLKISDDLAPIYALCMGNINIFEVNVARLTKTPVLNIRTLIQDKSNLGFKVLYERAGLPTDLYYATVILITVLREMMDKKELLASGIYVTKDTATKMIEKVTKIANDVNGVKNMDYILSLINHHSVAIDQSS
jgi:uncharacterized protein (DUF2336 family)